MKKSLLFVCAVAAGMLCAEEYKINFNAAKPWNEVQLYAKRLVAKTQDIKGRKATVVSLAAPGNKELDTAFGLMTQKFPVAGKKNITVSAQVLVSKGLDGFRGGNIHSTRIRFYDAKNKELKEFASIRLPKGNGEFQAVKGTYAVPANAAKAQIVFGFDIPNLVKDQIFAVTDVSWSTK